LEEVLGETLSLKTSDAAFAKIHSMLATLGDPFTRIVSPQEYASFRINNDGALEGVGLLISSDRDSGRLVVLSPIEGGPAARAGIISGDEVVQIDGKESLPYSLWSLFEAMVTTSF
jgi:carboxyl-terminal processing protease